MIMDRRNTIGGSDMGDLTNTEPFGCSRRLWYRFHGHEADYAKENQNALDRGTYLEKSVVAYYAHKYNKFTLPEMERKITYKDATLVAHVDAAMKDSLIEVKCPAARSFQFIKRNGLPEAYIMQAQWYLSFFKVTEFANVIFLVMWPDQWELLDFPVERDESIINMLQDEARYWIDKYPANRAPEKLSLDDKRCQTCVFRRTCQGGEINEVFVPYNDEEVLIDNSPVLADLVLAFDNARKIRVDAEAYEAECKDAIITALNGRDAVKSATGVIYYRTPKPGLTVDSKLLAHKWPEIYSQVTKPKKSSPTLKVYVRGVDS